MDPLEELIVSIPYWLWIGLGISTLIGGGLVFSTVGHQLLGQAIRPDQLGVVSSRSEGPRARCRAGGFELAIPWIREVTLFSRAPVEAELEQRVAQGRVLTARAVVRLSAQADGTKLLREPTRFSPEAIRATLGGILEESVAQVCSEARDQAYGTPDANRGLRRELDQRLADNELELLWAGVDVVGKGFGS